MAKPNYKFDKRQRDLAKKKEQDEKRLRKRAKNAVADPAEMEGAQAATPADELVANPPS